MTLARVVDATQYGRRVSELNLCDMPNATPCMCQQKMYVENDKEGPSISSIISPSSSSFH